MAQELNQAQAVNVLIQAARIAQSKGAFTLEDAELVAQAIRIFIPEEKAGEDAALNQEPAQAAAPVEPILQKVEK
jgi:hypothetical protein